MRLVLLLLLILVLLAAMPMWPDIAGWGYSPSGGIGVVVLILMVLLLARWRVQGAGRRVVESILPRRVLPSHVFLPPSHSR